jgi:sigma-B regulation protein RsbU (phosphoserine phosphatase)
MLEAFPLLAQTPAFPPRSELSWEFANIAGAVVLLSVALAAIAFFFLRRKTRDLTLLFFGLSCTLYALRLLAGQRIFRLLFDESRTFWAYFDWVITATIILPFGLFLFQLAGERLRKLFRWLLTIQGAFAIVGILGAAFGVDLAKLYFANNVMVLGTFFATAVFLVVTRRQGGPRKPFSHEIRVFLAGFFVWGLFVLHANLLGLKILRGRNTEFLGFMIFVGCLGYVTAHRTFTNEERLLAINKELDIARQIQSSTLPRSVPNLAGLDIAARYVPMSAVAGDFYDFLVVDERRLGILVADVTGHGVPAALIASMLKVAFAGQAHHADDPARVLAGLNRALCGKFEEHFVTAAYLFIDVAQSAVRYAGAGHPPLLVASLSPDGVREVEENGLMLGMFPDATYSAMELQLHTGDRCLLYTDGIVEATNSVREEFGKARLLQFLKAHGHLSADLFTRAFLDEVSRFSGHNVGRAQEDDITLLVLDFRDSQ